MLLNLTITVNRLNVDAVTKVDTSFLCFDFQRIIGLNSAETDPIFEQWKLDNATYLAALLDEVTEKPETKYLNGERQWVALPSVGDIEHDDTLNKNSNHLFQHLTTEQKTDFGIKATRRELVAAPANGTTYTLKNDTITTFSTLLTNANTLTLAAPTSTIDYVREFGIIIQIGATVPLINYPTNIKWATPNFIASPNSERMIVFIPITFDGTTWSYFASCDKN